MVKKSVTTVSLLSLDNVGHCIPFRSVKLEMESNIEHCNLNSCDFESVLLNLCHKKIHNDKVNRPEHQVNENIIFLYPKCTKTRLRASVKSIISPG